MCGRLWVVATPLGNLGDFSPRAKDTLTLANLILAEDTRRAGQLLHWAEIQGKRVLSLHEHNEAERIEEVLHYLGTGMNVALVSDAGTPLVADPGYRLVAACRRAQIPVVPIPGPSAPITALMASGLPPYPFIFLGFLPRRKGDILTLWRQFVHLDVTLVFFERKNRVVQSLDLAFQIFGQREFCLARELTKKHEAFIYGQLGQPLEEMELLGEITVLIAPPASCSASSLTEVKALAKGYIGQDLRPKEVARLVREQTRGWSSKEVYELVLETQRQSE